jgi:hypothetical protein
MDALDYACSENGPVINPVSKEVLSNCDYVVTEALEGQFEKATKKAIVDLLAKDLKLARTSLLGKKPDFSHLFSKETEYRREWVANLKIMSQTVRKGLILLDDDIGYVEHDALLTGALEVPFNLRYMYYADTQRIVRYSDALQGQYEWNMEQRLVQTASSGQAMAVQGLLKAKAAPNAEDLRGESVLLCACQKGEPQTIRCLLVAKATINAVNKEGFTALHLAAAFNKPDAVAVLLGAKADMFARSHKGNSILDFVKHEGHKAVINVLQQERENRKEAKEQVSGKSKFFKKLGGYL